MKITQVMSAEADAAAQRYELLVAGWRSIYSAALDNAQFGSARVLRDVTAQAYGIARVYLDSEATHIARASAEVAAEAVSAISQQLSVTTQDDSADAAGELLSASQTYLQREITIQVERDVAFLQNAVRKTAINVSLAARSQGIPARTALLQYRMGNAHELQFFFHDRMNRRYPSRKFVRSVWRDHLLSVYNETVLHMLADAGHTSAQVVTDDPNHSYSGMELSLTANSALPTYPEVRPEIFHPNADAVLGMVS